MCHQAVAAGVQGLEVRGQALGDVVGVELRDLGGLAQAFAAHHRDVHPADRQDRGAAEAGGADHADRAVVTQLARQERGQVFLDRARADARAAAAVRDAEGLVQVQVRNVRTPLAGLGHADQGVHVGAVGVHLAAVLVDDLADLDHLFLEHAVRGRVGHHDRGQAVAVLLGVEADVFHIDVAVGIGLGDHHLHAAHLRRGRVGAVRRIRDQADVAVVFAARAVVGADRQQAGVLALCAGVRLQADRVVAGAFDQHRFQRVDQFLVAQRLVGRHQRVDLRELRPGHRDHLGGGVELHGARTQRDHRAVHRQVLVGQRTQVAQQFVLAVVGVEHRVGQERGLAQQAGRQRVGGAGIQRVDVQRGTEHRSHGDDVGAGGGLVQADADRVAVDRAQVVTGGACLGMDFIGMHAGDVQGVEEVATDLHAGIAQRCGQDRGQAVRAAGNAGQAFRAVVNGVHRGHHRQQHLRGTDVGGGLLAADVLFAGLQGQAVGRVALGIDRNADQAARHRALVGVTAGHEGGVRATEAERHAETLAVADHDVRAPFARGSQQGQGQQVGGHGHQAAACVHGIDQRLVVADLAEGVRILQQQAERFRFQCFGRGADAQHDAHGLGAGTQQFQGLRVHGVVHEEGVRLRLGRTLGQGHRFGGGGGFVQQRGVGDFHAGQVGAQGLEVDQRFHAALRDFRLVRGIGGVPRRVFQDVAQDHVRRVGTVVTLADEAAQHGVLVGDRTDLRQCLHFGHRLRQCQRCRRLDLGRHDGVGHRIQRRVADDVEHLRDLGVVGADVALDERVVVLELTQGRGVLGHGEGSVRKGHTHGHKPPVGGLRGAPLSFCLRV